MVSKENLVILLATGLSNIVMFPALYVAYHKKLMFQTYFGLFTLVTSFMYHSMESIGLESFYLSAVEWHKLDNIGSIQCFIMLMVYFMDNLDVKGNFMISKHNSLSDLQLNLFGLFIVMIMQANHPWELYNTIYPIMFYTVLLMFKVLFIRRSRLNTRYFLKGVFFMVFAVFFFARGLNDDNDVLRLSHGLWHLFGGISSFYLWQSIDKDKPHSAVKNLKLTAQPRFELWPVVKSLLKLQFFTRQDAYLPHYN